MNCTLNEFSGLQFLAGRGSKVFDHAGIFIF